MSKKPDTNNLEVKDALKRLRSLKHGRQRAANSEARIITEAERDPTVGLLAPDGVVSLSSDDPASGGATATGLPLETSEATTRTSGLMGASASLPSTRISLGNWIGIVGLALTVLVAWVGLATYFHSDLKTDMRELRQDVREGDEAMQQSVEDLRADLQSVQQQVEDLVPDTVN